MGPLGPLSLSAAAGQARGPSRRSPESRVRTWVEALPLGVLVRRETRIRGRRGGSEPIASDHRGGVVGPRGPRPDPPGDVRAACSSCCWVPTGIGSLRVPRRIRGVLGVRRYLCLDFSRPQDQRALNERNP